MEVQMKSITIHSLDEPLGKLIKQKAEKEGLSLNKTIKNILEEFFGIKFKKGNKKRNSFSKFSGKWSKDDFKEFSQNTKEFEEINEEDWK